MVYVLYGHDRSSHRTLFDQLFKLRHDIFIKRRGWSLPSRDDREIDQYDTDEAVYFVDLDNNGRIQAHVRMTPTMRSSLTADYFPHLFENCANPRSPDIYEATRYMVLPADRDRTNYRLMKARLLAALVQWCLDQNHTHLQTVIDAGTLSAFVEVTMMTTPMGLAHPFGGGKGALGGGECLAFRWPIEDRVLNDIKRYGGLPDQATRFWEPMRLQVA
jgi:acyl-homoserine lactone synthase